MKSARWNPTEIVFALIILFGMIPLTTIAQDEGSNSVPMSLREDIEVNNIITVGFGTIRIVYHKESQTFYYVKIEGLLYELEMDGPTRILHYTEEDHGVNSVAGMTIGSDGTFYLVGNLRTSSGDSTYAVIKRGTPDGETHIWSTVAQTVPYPLNGHFDHNFNAIVVSPDEDSLYVQSGSRTDHGEAQYDEGPLAGLREIPLTSSIFRIPIDATDLILENDIDFLTENDYLFCEGVRNTFDMEFAPNGHLFGVENSGDRDDPEEINWHREGHHYGFPWRMGDNDTPQQFPGYDPDDDPLVSENSYAYMLGFFHDDPDYPPPPDGVTFTDPLPNYGPDGDKFRDVVTGEVHDASDMGMPLPSLTAHRSPLGLVFDADSVLTDEFKGDAFVLSHSTASGALNDTGEDLKHVAIDYVGGDVGYEVRVTRIVENFNGPVDAVMVGNKIYVVETFSGGATWEIVLPTDPNSVDDEAVSVAKTATLHQNYPNPFNPTTVISYQLPERSEIQLSIFDVSGQQIRELVSGAQSRGEYSVTWDGTDAAGEQVASGVYLYRLMTQNGIVQTRKMLLVR